MRYSEFPLLGLGGFGSLIGLFLYTLQTQTYKPCSLLVLLLFLLCHLYFDAQLTLPVFLWFIASEVFLFGSLFYSLFLSLSSEEHRMFVQWKQQPVQHRYVVDLLALSFHSSLLGISGLTANLFLYTQSFYRRGNAWRGLTFLLGSFFLLHQMIEFDRNALTLNGNFYWSSGWFLESVHFTHVSLGLFGWLWSSNTRETGRGEREGEALQMFLCKTSLPIGWSWLLFILFVL